MDVGRLARGWFPPLAAVASAAAIAWFVFLQSELEVRWRLSRISEQLDPAAMALVPGANPYVRVTPNHMIPQVGVVTMRDGSTAKFWFEPHPHDHSDLGQTLFKLSDGSELYLSGYFCCDFELPKDQFATLGAFREFVEKSDGAAP